MGRRLKDAMDRSGKSMGGPAEAFRESASLLTQKREAASPAPARAGKSSTSSASGSTARPPMSVASVRFSDSTLRSVIKDITLTEVRVIAKRDQQFPGILDQAVVDIEVAEGQVARLNGYVHQLQAVDKRQDTDFVGVTIRFVDEDPKNWKTCPVLSPASAAAVSHESHLNQDAVSGSLSANRSRGKWQMNSLPSPIRLRISRLPSWLSNTCLTIASPRPVPPVSLCRLGSAR